MTARDCKVLALLVADFVRPPVRPSVWDDRVGMCENEHLLRIYDSRYCATAVAFLCVRGGERVGGVEEVVCSCPPVRDDHCTCSPTLLVLVLVSFVLLLFIRENWLTAHPWQSFLVEESKKINDERLELSFLFFDASTRLCDKATTRKKYKGRINSWVPRCRAPEQGPRGSDI